MKNEKERGKKDKGISSKQTSLTVFPMLHLNTIEVPVVESFLCNGENT